MAIIIVIIIFFIVTIIIKNEKNISIKYKDKHKEEYKNLLLELKNIQDKLLKIDLSVNLVHIELSTLDEWRRFDEKEALLTLLDEKKDLYLNLKESMPEADKDYNNISDFIKEVEKYIEKNKENMNIIDCFLITNSINKTKSIYSKEFNQLYKEPIFLMVYTYRSPQGRNRYRGKRKIYWEDIKIVIEKIKGKKEYNNTTKYQRNLMTPGLRFDILQRDDYRCQICGVTANLGAILHVDHIKPISKGGLTKTNNLQTLCQTCNLGKSDKY